MEDEIKKKLDNILFEIRWMQRNMNPPVDYHGLGFVHLWFYKSLEDWLKKETVIYSLIYFRHKVYA